MPVPDRALYVAFLMVLIWAPLPWGSARLWSTAVLAGLGGCLGAGWLLLLAHGRVTITPALRQALPLLALWSALVLYTFLQAKAGWLSGMAPKSQSWAAAVQAIGIPLDPVVSIDAYATTISGWLSLALLILFALSLALINTGERLRTAVYVLIASGVIQSAYGIIAALASGDITVASGTYMNRNHFAGYLEMTLALGIGMLAGGPRIASRLTGWRDWLGGAIRFLLSEKAPLRIGILIMALGLILSRSRMGNSAFLASLTGVGLVCLLLSRGTFRVRLTILWVSILILDISFLGSYFGLRQLTERLEATTSTELDNRVDIHDLLQPYVQDFQPLGSGLGTFRKAFSTYYTEPMKAVYLQAENDYLQCLGEWGIAALVLPILVASSMAMAITALRRTRHIFIRGMAFAALMGIVSLLIHSAVDFNLQIPANALMFVFMLALGWLARHVSLSSAEPADEPAHQGKRRRRRRASSRAPAVASANASRIA